ncbi:GGDEF domain-containing protein [Clostridium sp.]|jgi:diguanylate cyclase (GGDEF)-like protein|uniref:GGDEF domain-containing protein n=1 Tax=Clostridium sp. TaxID=1506 RepID=UPI0035A1211C
MNRIGELIINLKKLCNLNDLFISKKNINNCKYIKTNLNYSNYYLYISKNVDYSTLTYIKKVVELFLKEHYESKLYLRELKSINSRLEKAVKYRTREIENKNKLLEQEKCKLNKANLKLTKLNMYLDNMSRKDPLTQLSNRRDLRQKFECEIKKIGTRPVFSLAIGDVDFFKNINDTYGHGCGDEVLKKIAYIFKNNLREKDVISRYGGEEFVVFLPETDLKCALSVIENIRYMIQNQVFEYNGQIFHMTMSFGLVSFNHSISFIECIERADSALYEAKVRGRNRVVLI